MDAGKRAEDETSMFGTERVWSEVTAVSTTVRKQLLVDSCLQETYWPNTL